MPSTAIRRAIVPARSDPELAPDHPDRLRLHAWPAGASDHEGGEDKRW